MSVSLEVLDQIIANLERAEAIVAKYADLIAQEAKHLAPVKTGALRDSITTHLDGLVAEITAGENLSDPRAVVMEYGSATVPSHAYLRPAMERYGAAFIAEIRALLG